MLILCYLFYLWPRGAILRLSSGRHFRFQPHAVRPRCLLPTVPVRGAALVSRAVASGVHVGRTGLLAGPPCPSVVTPPSPLCQPLSVPRTDREVGAYRGMLEEEKQVNRHLKPFWPFPLVLFFFFSSYDVEAEFYLPGSSRVTRGPSWCSARAHICVMALQAGALPRRHLERLLEVTPPARGPRLRAR